MPRRKNMTNEQLEFGSIASLGSGADQNQKTEDSPRSTFLRKTTIQAAASPAKNMILSPSANRKNLAA